MDPIVRNKNHVPSPVGIRSTPWSEQLVFFCLSAFVYALNGEDKESMGIWNQRNIIREISFTLARACVGISICNVFLKIRQRVGCPIESAQETALTIYFASALFAGHISTRTINSILLVFTDQFFNYIILTSVIALYLVFQDVQSLIAPKPAAGEEVPPQGAPLDDNSGPGKATKWASIFPTFLSNPFKPVNPPAEIDEEQKEIMQHEQEYGHEPDPVLPPLLADGAVAGYIRRTNSGMIFGSYPRRPPVNP